MHEIDTFDRKIKKAFDDTVVRLSTCELYCKDKVKEVKACVKHMEFGMTKFATKEMTDKMIETEKLTKMSTLTEFERF